MSALDNHFVAPFDDLTKDVVLIADDLRNGVCINSNTLAKHWLNLFDTDYHMEIRKYGTYERLFITTDIQFKMLEIIIGHLERKPLVLRKADQANELILLADKFGLKSLISNALDYSIANFCSTKKYLLIWIWRLCKHHDHKRMLYCWNEALYYVPLLYKIDEETDKGFKSLSFNELHHFLKDTHLNVYEEKQVLEMALHWYENTLQHRKLDVHIFMDKIFETSRISLDIEPMFASYLLKAYYFNKSEHSFGVLAPNLRRQPRDMMLLMGGWLNGYPTNKIEFYDERDGVWKSFVPTNLPLNLCYHGVASVDNKLYIVGGLDGINHLNSLYEFDTKTVKWKLLAPMTQRRIYLSVVYLDGFIYALGGHDGENRLASCEKYCIKSNNWIQMPDLSSKRSDGAATTVGSLIYVCGGFDGQTLLSSVEIYDTKSDKWHDGPALSNVKSGFSLVRLNNKQIVAIGGYDGTRRLATCEVLEIGGNQWNSFPSLSTPRSNFSAAVLAGKVYAIGGYLGSVVTCEVEYFDGKKWVIGAPIKNAMSAHKVVIVENIENAKFFYDLAGINRSPNLRPNFTKRSFINSPVNRRSRGRQTINNLSNIY
uniref:BACK domain-containing protein n=1 Tax=Rhabditophanes sp. KR3021 TaxID=114890 RepID=A0AC35UID3_9BILA